MRRIFDNVISLAVVVIVLFLIIPLPTQLLDILLVVNIGLSIMILMITMNISEALEFSICRFRGGGACTACPARRVLAGLRSHS